MPTPRAVASIIISAGNRGEAVERTLRSVEAQSFPSLEVLMCGPAEHTSVLRETAAPRFVSLAVEATDEGAGAWNAGLDRTSGQYVCCLLAGDELAPTYLEKSLFQMEVSGADAGAAGEAPPDSVPHIFVARRQVLLTAGGFDVRCPAGEQRAKLARLLARSGFRAEVVPEVLAHPADAPVGSAAAGWLPTPGFARRRRFSYARLVTGWPQARPTVLFSMPFLSMGGSEAAVSRLCRQLKGLGFRVLVYTTPVGESHGDTTAWFEDSAVGIYHLSSFLDIDHWPAFIAYLVQQHGVSVLCQVGSSYTYDLLPRLRKLFPQLAVVDLLFNPDGHTADYFQYRHLIDHVVSEHSGMKAWLLEHGEREERVSIIPNGVDLEEYSPRPKLDWRTRQPRAADDGRFIAAFLGRLSEEKAPDVFLEIAALLRDEPAIEFLLCGTGPMELALRSEAAARGLAGRVHFLGFVSSHDYLPCCDTVVVCSRLDGRPNIVMESLAMGVPVVASRVGGIPAMMPPGEGDLLCEPAKADAFAAAIRRLAGDADRYRRSAEVARQHAEKHFSIVENGCAYARLFEDLRHKLQALDRHVAPETIAASLGYKRIPEPSAPFSAALRRLQAHSPWSWFGHFRNALLLWRLRRGGRKPQLLERFDEGYYTRQFPENMRWKRSPLLHYIFFGYREGRNPSARFDTRFYLAANPDVRRTGFNPLLHFVMWGEREGRFATPPRLASQGKADMAKGWSGETSSRH
jgi:glycosyltransferase involved in cell wall biosynthesis